LGGDSSAFVDLIHALARASRETLLVQKYRDACAQARLTLQELKDLNRALNESETRAIVRKVDQLLGHGSINCDSMSPEPMSPHPAFFPLVPSLRTWPRNPFATATVKGK
jgi:hypothetical protein